MRTWEEIRYLQIKKEERELLDKISPLWKELTEKMRDKNIPLFSGFAIVYGICPEIWIEDPSRPYMNVIRHKHRLKCIEEALIAIDFEVPDWSIDHYQYINCIDKKINN